MIFQIIPVEGKIVIPAKISFREFRKILLMISDGVGFLLTSQTVFHGLVEALLPRVLICGKNIRILKIQDLVMVSM